MTRTGKIARLPRDLREQVNRRLDNGVEGKQIVEWLNTLPEVQSVIAAQFDGRPVNAPNLSHWKCGGYRDWLERREALDITRLFTSRVAGLSEAAARENSLRRAF